MRSRTRRPLEAGGDANGGADGVGATELRCVRCAWDIPKDCFVLF